MRKNCIECNQYLDWDVFNYSIGEFGIPLCIEHQQWLSYIDSTMETKLLYIALRIRGVPALLEKFDGYKTIDIAVPEAKINIEVDGGHHNYNYHQAMADLKRSYYSFLKGYLTLRIPNSLIQNNIEETAEYIIGFLNKNNYRNWERW